MRSAACGLTPSPMITAVTLASKRTRGYRHIRDKIDAEGVARNRQTENPFAVPPEHPLEFQGLRRVPYDVRKQNTEQNEHLEDPDVENRLIYPSQPYFAQDK